MYEGYPPGYDPSMDPTLGGGGYQIGYDPMAGAQMAPPPGMGHLGVAGLAAPQAAAAQLGGHDQVTLGAAKGVELMSNAFFLSAMASPILANSGIRGLAAYGRFAGAVDPFRGLGVGHRMLAKPGWQAGRAVGGWASSASAAMRGTGSAFGGRAMASFLPRMALRASGMGARMAIAGSAAATGYGIPLAAAMVAMEAPIRFAEGMAGDVMNANMGETILSASAPRGMSYSTADARAWGRGGMNDLGDQLGIGRGGMEQLTSMIAGSGGLNGASDIREFTTKLRQQINSLKEVSNATGAALDEAHQMIQALKSQGFRGGDIVSQAQSLTARGSGGVSNLNEGSLYALGSAGSDVGRQLGLNRGMMFDRFVRGGSSMAFGQERGLIDSNLVNFYGGAEQAAMMVETTAVQSFMGSQLMGYAMDADAALKGQSIIDPTRMQQVLTGRLTQKDLDTVSREQIAASLQSTARNTLVPHAQSAMVNMATQGGVTDATASARMATLGFAQSPEQALLMIQEHRAEMAEQQRAQVMAGRQAGQARADSYAGAHQGYWGRAWEGSWAQGGWDGLYNAGAAFGRGVGHVGSGVNRFFGGGQSDTQVNITTASLQRARNMTMSDVRQGRTAFSAARSRGQANRTLGWYEDRPGWDLVQDMREGDEEYYESIYRDVRRNPYLMRHSYTQNEANRRWSADAEEGVDFIRSEADHGTDYFTEASAWQSYNEGGRQGVAAWRGASTATQEAASQALMGLQHVTGNFDRDRLLAIGAAGGGFRRSGDGWHRYDPNGRPSRANRQRAAGLRDEDLITLALNNEILAPAGLATFATGEEAVRWTGEERGRRQQLLMEVGGISGIDIGEFGNTMGGGMSVHGDISNIRGTQAAIRGEASRWVDALSAQGISTTGLADAIAGDTNFAADFARMTQLAGAGGFGTADGIQRTREARQIALRNQGAGGETLRAMAEMMSSDRGGLMTAMDAGWNDRRGQDTRAERLQGTSNLEALSLRRDYFEASNASVNRLSEDVRAWEASKTGENAVDRAGRIGNPDQEGSTGWTQLHMRAFGEESMESWQVRDLMRDRIAAADEYAVTANRQSAFHAESGERADLMTRVRETIGEGSMTYATGGGAFGSVRVGDGEAYNIESQEDFNRILSGSITLRSRLGYSMGTEDRWSTTDAVGTGQRRTGSLGAEFLQGLAHIGGLGENSSIDQRRAASREVIAGLYDLEGDATAERAAFMEATRGRGSRAIDLMDMVLNSETDQLTRARNVAAATGTTQQAALQAIQSIDEAGGEDGDREQQIREAIELLGGQLDTTLVDATEQQVAASEAMSGAASDLRIAAENLNSAAAALGGDISTPTESTPTTPSSPPPATPPPLW